MKAVASFVAVLLALSGATARAAPAAPPLAYQLQAATPSHEGGFDYVSVEQPSGRVFVGRSFGVEVMEGDRLRTLLERQGVASVLLIGPRLLLTTNRSIDQVTLVDRMDGRVLADIPAGKSPDGAVYDEATERAFVMTGGSKDVTVIDVPGLRALARIPLNGKPEAAVLDGAGHLFVNLEDRNQIAVIDTASRRITSRYALAGCDEPTGLALDRTLGVLAAACRNGVLKFIDSRSGQDRGQLDTCKGADASIFNADRRVGFVPCLDGGLTIYRLDEAGRVTATQALSTRVGGRTAAYDSVRDRLYIAVADVERDAEGRYLRARQNFQVLTVAPAGSSR